jgi:hypothetical protein
VVLEGRINFRSFRGRLRTGLDMYVVGRILS